MTPVDTDSATKLLMRFLAVEGVTGREKAIGKEVVGALREAGVPAKSIRFDDANTRIPVPTQTGNLIVDIPGRGALASAKRLLFMTHLDTVPLCAGAKAKRVGRKIVSGGDTALGGDNRTGCAVLVTMIGELMRQKLDHPPLTLLFTVREESGLYGARHLHPAELGDVAMGFNYDGRSACDVVIGAVGADRWEVEILGKASHAGGSPERGISSTMILSLALADVRAKGWFGKIDKNSGQGTSNIGPVGGRNGGTAGDATNVVTDYVHVRGESRAHDAKFVKEITSAYKTAFQSAAETVTNSEGKAGRIKFRAQMDYYPFRLKETLPVVQRAISAVTANGGSPNVRVTNGGLDANWMVRHGIPTVTFGAGQNLPHTVEEWVDLNEFDAGCRLALTLATMA